MCFLKYQTGFLDQLLWVPFFRLTGLYSWALFALCITRNETLNSHVLNSCSPWVHVVNFIFFQIMARSYQVRIEFCQYWKFRGAIVLFLVRLDAVIKIMNGVLSNKRHKINSFRKAILGNLGRFVESFGEKSVFHIWLFDAVFIIAIAFHWWAGLSWESVSINLITVTFD